MAPKGRAFRSAVSLDRYPRVGKDGEISYPLLGYEFCIPAKDWLIKMHPGTSERYGFVRKQGSAQMMRLHPKHSTSSDMHSWAISVRHPRGYNDTLVYARVSMWALNLLIEGTEVWRMTEVESATIISTFECSGRASELRSQTTVTGPSLEGCSATLTPLCTVSDASRIS